MDVRTGEPALERARARWRATGDRVWAVAVVDGEEYRRVAELVGGVLDDVRERTPTLEDLLALDADPAPVLDRWSATAGASPGGARAAFEAACAVRGEELLAARARGQRVAAITAARAAGQRWVVLDEVVGSTSRSVAMRLDSGHALVATADPYAGDEPYALAETVLDVRTGEPVAGGGGREDRFADVTVWRAERARRRSEIDSRLDGGGRDDFR